MTAVTEVQAAADWLKANGVPSLTLAVTLGSGLSDVVAQWPFKLHKQVPYTDIPGMSAAKVQGHAAMFSLLEVAEGRYVGVFAGRTHAYETPDLDAVVFNTRLAKALGAESLLLTNAAGGIGERQNPGSLMLIEDHINLTGLHPLRGPNLDELGPRFYDMSDAYNASWRERIQALADELNTELTTGVYAWVLGPSYETPAEIRMMRTLGASAVGMSTVPEVLAAKHMGMSVAAISCITNKAAGLQSTPLNHQEVLETAKQAEARLSQLLQAIIKQACA